MLLLGTWEYPIFSSTFPLNNYLELVIALAGGRNLYSNPELWLAARSMGGKIEEKLEKLDNWINLFENKLPLIGWMKITFSFFHFQVSIWMCLCLSVQCLCGFSYFNGSLTWSFGCDNFYYCFQWCSILDEINHIIYCY